MEKAEGQNLSAERRNKLDSIVSWIESRVADEYSGIEESMQDWLSQEYPTEYRKAIQSWKPSVYSTKAEEWLEGHMESYRHARGQALRMAVFENIGKVLKGDYRIEEIEEEAENQFNKVMEINLESLSHLTEHLTDEERIVQIKEKMIRAESNLYDRLFIKTLIAHERAGEDYEDMDSVQVLKSTWSKIKQELNEVEKGDRYWKFSSIISRIDENFETKQSQFEDTYGVWLTKEKDKIFYNITKPSEMNLCTKAKEDVVPNAEVTEVTEETPVSA
jgi:hypothetical protein